MSNEHKSARRRASAARQVFVDSLRDRRSLLRKLAIGDFIGERFLEQRARTRTKPGGTE